MYVITRKDNKGREVYLKRILDIAILTEYFFTYDLTKAIYYHRPSDASSVLARYRIPNARVTPLLPDDDIMIIRAR